MEAGRRAATPGADASARSAGKIAPTASPADWKRFVASRSMQRRSQASKPAGRSPARSPARSDAIGGSSSTILTGSSARVEAFHSAPRGRPDQHLVRDEAERPDVGRRGDLGRDDLALLLCDLLPGRAELLGRRVGGRADVRRRLRHGVGELRDPEVEHLERDALLRVLREEQVLRLEVAVKDPRGVRLVERVCELLEHARDERGAERPLALDARVEPLAREQLHREERHAELLVDVGVEEVDDVRVLADARAYARLAHEHLPDLLVLHELAPHELQRDRAVHVRVDRPPHDRHSALPEDGFEAVATAHESFRARAEPSCPKPTSPPRAGLRALLRVKTVGTRGSGRARKKTASPA
jgi:hypothetical protein